MPNIRMSPSAAAAWEAVAGRGRSTWLIEQDRIRHDISPDYCPDWQAREEHFLSVRDEQIQAVESAIESGNDPRPAWDALCATMAWQDVQANMYKAHA